MFASNEFSTSFGSFSPLPIIQSGPQQGPPCPGGLCNISTGNVPESAPFENQETEADAKKQALRMKLKKVIHIPGIKDLIRQIGVPDVTDMKYGGLAVWAKPTLKKKNFGFLRRVEIIDEQVGSTTPVPHNGNVYIWVRMKPNNEQQSKILQLSKNMFYDRKKELMIIRSNSLDTAVAMAALVILYLRGNVSYYNIVNNNMMKVYFEGVKDPKKKRAIYAIVNTTK